MAGFGEALRLVLEKSWTIGLLLLIAGGGAWFATKHGQTMPPIVQDWALPAALLGVALIVLSIVSATLDALWSVTKEASKKRKKRLDGNKAAIANIETLEPYEIVELDAMLKSSKERFQIDGNKGAFGALKKGALVDVEPTSSYTIVEIHPEIIKRKDQIEKLRNTIGSWSN